MMQSLNNIEGKPQEFQITQSKYSRFGDSENRGKKS